MIRQFKRSGGSVLVDVGWWNEGESDMCPSTSGDSRRFQISDMKNMERVEHLPERVEHLPSVSPEPKESTVVPPVSPGPTTTLGSSGGTFWSWGKVDFGIAAVLPPVQRWAN